MNPQFPRFYHIAFTPGPGADPLAIQGAIETVVQDWYRYAPNCYLVWATADATMIAGALMTVPGMSAGGVRRQLNLPAVWDAVQRQVEESPRLEAKTRFEWLQREYPGQFSDGQIRTLQRRIKLWRAIEGPAQEVYFGQRHVPGRLCASDFTHMAELGITLEGQTFEHLVYHFVLTYSNWETGTICYSESLESLSEGWQNAVWELVSTPV
jgi:hypothetical protein